MSLHPGEYISHRNDLIADYIFFGEAFNWSPTEVDKLGWSLRKEIKELFIDLKNKQAEEAKNRR